MTRAAPPPSRRPAGRGFVLLVLAVLVGVLAMHGLGPGPAPVKGSAAAEGHSAATVTGNSGHQPAEYAADCSHTDGGPGHVEHADGTCAAAGVGGAYVPPVLAAALHAGPVPLMLPGSAAGRPESGRAPPDLAELQLLRI